MIGEYFYRAINKLNTYLEKKRTFTDEYSFDDRQGGYENLLLIIAGFQPYYWDEVFSRVKYSQDSFNESIDVCVCIPKGIKGSKMELRNKCERLGWSCLYLKKDLLSQVQNVAIRLHPSAQYIFKIDEDILLCKNYFSKLKHAYCNADGKTPYPIGFMGPVININAFGSYRFLKTLGVEQEYEDRFGKYEVYFKGDDSKNRIHKSPEVAKYLWEKSIPFDEVADKISDLNKGKFTLSPVRFSIGAILFKRDFWTVLGGFKVGKIGAMGVEEVQTCGFCMVSFYPIFVAEDVFVGHLGFYTQKEKCKEFFFENLDKIKIK